MFVFADSQFSYTIKKGDTLYSISKKYNIKLDSLKNYNNITNSTIIFPGMKINIPGGYTVKKGDTMYSIARDNNVDVKKLLELNNMDMNVILKVGQFIHLPVGNTIKNLSNKQVVSKEVQKVKQSTTTVWPHGGDRQELTGKLRGIKIKGYPGDSIVSVNNGRVVWASDYGIYKKLILIESNNGIVYGYGGNESAKVKVGDYVTQGKVIGVLGNSNESAEAFFFVYKNGQPLDPINAPRI